MPAELRFLEVARSAVRLGLVGSACDPGCERDLQLATDDEADVYARMQVPASPAGGVAPPMGELNRLLLHAAVEFYEIAIEGDQLLGVLQRPLVDDNHR